MNERSDGKNYDNFLGTEGQVMLPIRGGGRRLHIRRQRKWYFPKMVHLSYYRIRTCFRDINCDQNFQLIEVFRRLLVDWCSRHDPKTLACDRTFR